MTSKVSSQQILKKLEQGFKSIDQRFDGMTQRFDGVDRRFGGVDQRLIGIDGRLEGIDGRLDGIDGRLDRLEMAVANHDNKLAKLVTSEEFSRFRVENVHFQYSLTKRWEEAEEANGDLHRLQRRLEIKVKSHEKVLKARHLLVA